MTLTLKEIKAARQRRLLFPLTPGEIDWLIARVEELEQYKRSAEEMDAIIGTDRDPMWVAANDLKLQLAAREKRIAELERLLGYLRIPLELAIGEAPKLHDSSKPPCNITVVWHTGLDTAMEMKARLTDG